MSSVGASILVFSFVFALGSAMYPFQNYTLPWEERVDDLVSRLTIAEISRFSVDYVKIPPASAERIGVHPYNQGTECLRGYVRSNATAWPQSLGLAATFSRDVVFNMSEAVATELRGLYNDDVSKGIYGQHGLSCFSPVINIMRHPLWGRNQETYGEDPFLSGELAASYVHGLQGNHPRYIRANAGCKHFDVHGGPENIPVSRMSFDSKVSERDWRMTFLPQFKKCVEAGTYNLMCSYNSIDGVPACASEDLLINKLRNEWKFKGYVISDAGAISNILNQHRYVKTKMEAAVAAIKAGCNMELTGESDEYFLTQVDAVQQGKLTETEVRDNISPVFYTRLRLGEFDPPEMNPYTSIPASVILSIEHRALATMAAIKSFVLLKNDGNVLPLSHKYDQIAVVGPFAKDGDMFGDYAANPDKKFVTTPLDGLELLATKTEYAAGCNDAHCEHYDDQSVQTAVKEAEIIFVCLGAGVTVEAEGHDRASLDLPGKQLDLLKDAVYYGSANAIVVLLLFNAGPLDITYAKLEPRVNVIMECFLPAMAAGDALHDVIMARSDMSPAGRLPATWPANLNQIPPITNYTMVGRTYRYYEGEPLYPFGYGLSYTTFHYETLTVSPKSVSAGNNVTATVTVTNSGSRTSDEVVQLYMSWGSNVPVPVPQWTLVGFDRQRIDVSQSRTFTFTVTSEQMQVWTDKWEIIPGTMTLYASGQQPNQRTSNGANVLSETFTITASGAESQRKQPDTETNNIDETLRFEPKKDVV